MKIEATKDGGLHLTQDGTDAAGKPIQTELTGKCDGKDIPRRTIFAKRLIDR